jgi:hypothetical protein
MGEKISRGSWVEIHSVILNQEDRAPQVPEDTKTVPLEMRAKGFLAADAEIGKDAAIVTRSGRTLTGTLVAENPAYEHRFGPPIPELLSIGDEVRSILDNWRDE